MVPQVLQTTFPNLRFPLLPVKLDLAETSASQTGPRRYPRTDLVALEQWATFHDEVHESVLFAMQSQDIGAGDIFETGCTRPLYFDPPELRSEEEIRAYASTHLHDVVRACLKCLGIRGIFTGSNTKVGKVIGDPDYTWVGEGDEHSKFFFDYKAPWAANLDDLKGYFDLPAENRDRNARQSIEALEQIYGYMTFNHGRYGGLGTWEKFYFFRRVECADRRTLQFAGPIKLLNNRPSHKNPSILKAFVAMILLSNKDWFYASPTLCQGLPARHFSDTDTGRANYVRAMQRAVMIPTNGTYDITPLDYRLCHFDLTTLRRGRNSCVLNAGTTSTDLEFKAKLVDISGPDFIADALAREVAAYATLNLLQGSVIPRVYGYFEVWGMLRMLALEDVGDDIDGLYPNGAPIPPNIRAGMMNVLKRLHSAGFLHGDIARRNFCVKNGEFYILDLEDTVRSDVLSERKAEMLALAAL